MRYDKYKASGIEWLSEIPEHWDTDRLKNIFSFGTGLSITKKNLIEVGIPCVNYGEIHSKFGFEVNPKIHSLKCVSEEYLVTSKKSLLKNGDFIFADTSEDIAGSGNFTYLNSNTQVFAGYHTIAAKPKFKLNHRYIAYLFDSTSYRSQFRSTVVGIKVYSITQGLLNRLKIYFPPLEEQTAIAQYLDTKTQAIDKKVNLLTKKADYYKKLRKSIINDAVCKGLDKNVELKESGIEWIGKIPKHWEVKRFKDVVSKYTTGGTPSTSNTEFFNGNNTWICISDISDDKYIASSKMKLTDEALKSANILKTPKGSLLYSFKLSIGKMAFVTEDVYTNEAILSIFPNKYIDLEYYYFMLPMFMLLSATENIYGAKMLNQKLIASAFVLHPPKEEQTAIANYLDEKTQKIDAIVTNINNQIDTLKELRKTLINDVVTGKIKVIL